MRNRYSESVGNWRERIALFAFDELKQIDDDNQCRNALSTLGYSLKHGRNYRIAIEVFDLLCKLFPKRRSYFREKQMCLAILQAKKADLQQCTKELANERIRSFDKHNVIKSCLLELVNLQRFDLAKQLLQNDFAEPPGNRVLQESIKALVLPTYYHEMWKQQNSSDRVSSHASLQSAFEHAVTPFQDWTLMYRGKPDSDQIIRDAFRLLDIDNLASKIPIESVRNDDDTVSWTIHGISRLLAEYGQTELLRRLESTVSDRDKPRLQSSAALGFACANQNEVATSWINRCLEFVLHEQFQGDSLFAFFDCAKAARKIGDSLLQNKISNLILKEEDSRNWNAKILDLFLELDSLEFAEKAVEKMGFHDLRCERGKIAVYLFKKGDQTEAYKIMTEQSAAVAHNKPSMFVNGAMDDHSWTRTMVANQWLELGQFDKALEIFDLITSGWQHKFVEYFGAQLSKLEYFNEEFEKYERWARSFESPRLRGHSFTGLYRSLA